MEFKVNFSLKTTLTITGCVVQKNKFIMKNGYKGWQLSFIPINNSNINITKKKFGV